MESNNKYDEKYLQKIHHDILTFYSTMFGAFYMLPYAAYRAI